MFLKFEFLMCQECHHNISEREQKMSQMRVRSGIVPVMDER